jgi:peptidoglycan/LPS O-acetylase OafA/YrhL
MERVIVGGVLARRVAPGFLIGALLRALGYARNRIWLRWSLAALAGAVVFISCTGLWGYLMHHAVVLLLPLPVLLAGWLVIGAEQARQMQRPMRTCRRQ